MDPTPEAVGILTLERETLTGTASAEPLTLAANDVGHGSRLQTESGPRLIRAALCVRRSSDFHFNGAIAGKHHYSLRSIYPEGTKSQMTEPLYTRDALPNEAFEHYQKVRPTPAVRIPGSFSCLTSEGNIATCSDGWLAIDSRGYPYPINSFEFDLTYRQATLDA